jgi:DMSO/TMAO reductase YedYZ molybdopterin-dependent catalytic subunit
VNRPRVVTTADRGLGRLHARFTSPLHDDAVAARLGLALGVLFGVSAATCGYSHLLQHPIGWLPVPARPAGLYRVTQGVHVTAGFAAIPVLLAKLWVVAPKLVEAPAIRDARHALERVLLLPHVGGGVLLLFSGVGNVARWYPWGFFFPTAHYWTAWIAIGALVVHIGATWSTSTAVLRRREQLSAAWREALADQAADRRRFLGGVAGTAAVLALSTVGGAFTPLSRLAFLAQRRPHDGPQGIPINKTAAQAHVAQTALDPAWRLTVDGAVREPLSLSLEDLRALPQRAARLPIACVEGWSVDAEWSGVPVRHLLDLAGARRDATVRVHSIQPSSRYSSSELNRFQARDRDTLLALQVHGEVLHVDHGFPTRLIAPNRPGVEQTKWVGRLEVR